MASRRGLLYRSETLAAESPAPDRSASETPAPADRPVLSPLPPYEPPSCQFTDAMRQKLATFSTAQDHTALKKHLALSIKYITNATTESNERVQLRKGKVDKLLARERAKTEDGEEVQRGSADTELIVSMAKLQSKVDEITSRSEESLRALIDYKAELQDHGLLYENLLAKLDVATMETARVREARVIREERRQEAREARAEARRAARAERGDDGEEDEEDEDEDVEEPEEEFETFSALDALLAERAQWRADRDAKTMRERYANDNDYVGFKRLVHDARHPGEEVPNSRTWFPNDATTNGRRQTMGADDDDDDIVVTGRVESLKCPLTLRTFVEPYANNVCSHVFEKSAILEYHKTAIAQQLEDIMNQTGRRPAANRMPQEVRCPAAGCDKMLKQGDFYLDELMVRKVRRAERAAAVEEDEEDMAEELSSQVAEEDAANIQHVKAERLTQQLS